MLNPITHSLISRMESKINLGTANYEIKMLWHAKAPNYWKLIVINNILIEYAIDTFL